MENSDVEQSGKARDGRRRNNLRHGLRAATLGKVPKGASYVGRLLTRLRKDLEAAVVEAKGELNLQDSLTVNTACRWERHALLANRWLAHNSETMTFDQRLNFSRDIARAAENRDRAVRNLGLDQNANNIIEALYSSQKPILENGASENEH